jgi:acetyltransferase-like isoleucine patch superfamily enzyme
VKAKGVAVGTGVVVDDGVKIGKSSVIGSGYHFGADFYQFCRVGSLPHRFLSLW